MATDDKHRDHEALADRALGALAGEGTEPNEQERADFEALAAQVEEPGLQDQILEKYLSAGQRLLADSLPSSLDSRLAQRLGRLLGSDVSDVRVHKGGMASAAARAMGARAFAIGSRDIFIDEAQVDAGTARGRSVLAHEVAHTRDPAAAYAMSREDGGGTSAREAHAERVEMEYAQEDAAETSGGSQPDARQPAAQSPVPSKQGEDGVDKDKLERRVWQLLQEGDRFQTERHGR